MSDLTDFIKAPGAGIEAEGDFDAINALYLDRGWGDGLPIVPPTAVRVEAMLAYCDRPWDEVVRDSLQLACGERTEGNLGFLP
jgi:hypothetical protein